VVVLQIFSPIEGGNLKSWMGTNKVRSWKSFFMNKLHPDLQFFTLIEEVN